MKKTIVIIIVLIFIVVTERTSMESLFAQQQSNFLFPRTNPPALSAWLEMERNRSSVLDSYNQYVKPRLEMERLLSTQQMSINRQQNAQQTMQKELASRRRGNITGNGSSTDIQYISQAVQTGKNATFRNYLHFYPDKGLSGRK